LNLFVLPDLNGTELYSFNFVNFYLKNFNIENIDNLLFLKLFPRIKFQLTFIFIFAGLPYF